MRTNPMIEKWFNERGELHREDGPAFVEYTNSKFFFKNMSFPLFKNITNFFFTSIFSKKIKNQYWYKNGELHREDGPACIENNGEIISYYQNNLRHRIDGPAVVLKVKDVLLSESWYRNGKLHRIDGPAFFSNEGDECWYKEGDLHRENGPAKIDKDKKMWYRNGKLHRIDGPAIEIKSESNLEPFLTKNTEYIYFLNGEGYSEHAFYQIKHYQKLDKELPNSTDVQKRIKI